MKRWLLFFCLGTAGLYGDPAKVGIIHIDKEISSSTYTYVHYAIDHFEKEQVSCIVVHLDTPGGEVFPAIKIANRLRQTALPVIAYVDNWAISAGAMIAYACPSIYVRESAIMGAAESVERSTDGSAITASEKVNSALRARFAVLAKAEGRNPLIAQAMVDRELIVVSRNQKILSLPFESEIQPADIVITRKGKLLTLDAQELVHWGVADVPLTQSLFETSPWAQSELLEFSSWRVGVFTLLSHPAVAALLSIGILAGLYMEYAHPSGLGVCLTLFCLGVTLLTQYSLELFYSLESLMVLLGAILIVLEMWVLPGHLFLGVLGLVFLVSALCITGLPQVGDVHLPSTFLLQTIRERLTWFVSLLASALLLCTLWGKRLLDALLRNSPLVLHEEEDIEEQKFKEDLMHTTGIAICPCRPSGKVRVGEQQYDAISKGQYIREGSRVKIVTVQGSTVVIEEEI